MASTKDVVRFEDLPDVCTCADVQRYLKLSKNAVAALLASGKIRSVRAGRRVLISRDAIREYLNG